MEYVVGIWSSHVRPPHVRAWIYGRGNDWNTQQWLLRQIKTIDFQGVNTTRRFAAALREF
jgi:hypothetical protein